MSEDQPAPTDNLAELVEVTKQKVLHLLKIFPAVSASMIQTGIGTSTSPKLWRPILEELVAQGEVIHTKQNATSPHDRHQVHTVYHLSTFDYQAYYTQATKAQTAEPSPQNTVAA